MSMSLVISATLSSNDTMPDIAAMFVALVRLRGRRFRQRVLRRQAEGQQLHRHARHESGDHRVRAEDVEPVDQRRVHRRLPEHRPPGAVRPAAVHVLPRRILAIIVWYVFEHTPVGRHMFATGGNPEAARLAGLRTDRLVWGSLVASGVIAGFAGIIYGWKVGNYAPDRRSRLPVPGDRRRVLRRLAAQGPPERVGHVHRPATPSPGASRDSSSRSRRTRDGSSRCSRACRCWPPCRWPVTRAWSRRARARKLPRRSRLTRKPTHRRLARSR